MFKFTKSLLKYSKNNFSIGLCTGTRISNYSIELKPNQNDSEVHINKTKPSNNSIVAAAFASLNTQQVADIKTPFTDERITQASTVDDLLSISQGVGVSRRHALKVVSVLADWTNNGKVELNDFEEDPRFIKLCRILTKNNKLNSMTRITHINKSEDLAMIMNVAADDEAAKLIASITVPQMIKVFQTLGYKKRRSTSILRSLSYNLTRSSDILNLKQCADLLYSITVLNFPDENLLNHICNNIVAGLDGDLKKSAVTGSIVTSLGYLRYKDSIGTLDALCSWFLKNYNICRAQDIFALFLTLGAVNFEPTQNKEQFYKVLIPLLNINDAQKSALWLDIVLSLAVLNKATPEHVNSVLSERFLKELEEETGLSYPIQLKLLNLHGFVTNLTGYKSSPAPESILNLQLTRSKNKELMVNSVIDSLKNLMTPESLRTDVNSKMGFFIDAVCYLDNKCTPIKVDHIDKSSASTKVAVMVYDYHDMSRGRVELSGINVLATRLLEAQGFKILAVPYTEYKVTDKLVQRVKYLENKLKSSVTPSK